MVFGLVSETRANDNVAVLKLGNERVKVFWKVLAVCVELDRAIVAMRDSVFGASLECAGKAQVNGQVQEAVSVLAADVGGAVA